MRADLRAFSSLLVIVEVRVLPDLTSSCSRSCSTANSLPSCCAGVEVAALDQLDQLAVRHQHAERRIACSCPTGIVVASRASEPSVSEQHRPRPRRAASSCDLVRDAGRRSPRRAACTGIGRLRVRRAIRCSSRYHADACRLLRLGTTRRPPGSPLSATASRPQHRVELRARSRPSRRARRALPVTRDRTACAARWRARRRVLRGRAAGRARRARRARSGPARRRPRSDDAPAARERLEHHVRRALDVARQHEHVGRGHPRRHAPSGSGPHGAQRRRRPLIELPRTARRRRASAAPGRRAHLRPRGGEIVHALLGLEVADVERERRPAGRPSSARAAARSRGWNRSASTPFITTSTRSRGRRARRPRPRERG